MSLHVFERLVARILLGSKFKESIKIFMKNILELIYFPNYMIVLPSCIPYRHVMLSK